MRADYLIRRFGLFLVVVFLAATLNFLIPKFSGQDPVRERLINQALMGGHQQEGMQQMVEEYQKKFGLDKPLWLQYRTFLWDTVRLKFGYSIANYPKTVNSLLAESLPWSIGLLGMATLMSYTLGILLGAVLGWGKAPRALRVLLPPVFTLSAVPYYLLGLVLLFFFAIENRWLPLFGGYTAGTIPQWMSLGFWGNVLKHSTLPALSIVLAGMGIHAIAMRGMMVTVQGEDFMTMAEAKGLRDRTVFLRYSMRNAILPQFTALAISLSHVVNGAVLVEVVFGYPGMGTTLYHSIREFDYFAIQGIVLTIIVAVAIATFIVDILCPVLDPRISYRRA